MIIHKELRTRRGFTLPELLVATALVVLLMSIIADAFSQSLQSFRLLKSTGDLQAKLRTAVTVLRKDLLTYHFGRDAKLSDLRDNRPPPDEGFFLVHPGLNAASQPVREGQDIYGLPSYRGYQYMQFTVNSRGRRPEYYFRAQVPALRTSTNKILSQHGPAAYRQGGVMISHWAVISYFNLPSFDTADQPRIVGNNLPLYSLHRRVRLLVDDSAKWGTVPDNPTNRNAFANVAYWSDGSNLHFHDSETIQNPDPKIRPAINVPTGLDAGFRYVDRTRLGDDLLIADALSFQIELLAPGSLQFRQVKNWPPNGRYDTHDADRSNQPLRAIRITIRIWDSKMEQARQVTIIQDM